MNEKMDKEYISRLQLIRSSGIGPATYQHLLRKFGSARLAIENIKDGSVSIKKSLRIISIEEIKREIEYVKALDGFYLFSDDPDYPNLLRQTPLAPAVLIGRGIKSLLKKDKVAIVGARNASHTGQRIVRQFAEELANNDYVTVSGMARGIDASAHEASLHGGTIAILAGGIDKIYPPENKALYYKIAQDGLLLSEMPPGCEPQARLFPRRNRIIAGLTELLIVAESSLKSGSRITADLAADYGREVAAVPGSPLDSRNLGALNLMKDGAHIITSIDDILSILEQLKSKQLSEPSYHFTSATLDIECADISRIQQMILDYLGTEPCPLQDIMLDIPSDQSIIIAALAEMELEEKIQRHWDNRIQKI